MSTEKSYLVGYALLWNVGYLYPDEYGRPFIEMIAPGALDKADMGDVLALISHDVNLLLGRTTSGTLTLKTDEKGLLFQIEVPKTSLGADTATLVSRGDLSQCSWGFSLFKGGDTWTTTSKGTPIRTIVPGGVGRVHDVTITPWGANSKTTVSVKSMVDPLATNNRSGDREAMASELDRAKMQMELTHAQYKADKLKFEHETSKRKFEHEQWLRNAPGRAGIAREIAQMERKYGLR